MPNVTTTQPPQASVPSSPARLPESVKRAVADSLALDAGNAAAGQPWQLPTILPPLPDLRAGIGLLEVRLVAASQDVVRGIVLRLCTTFEPHVKRGPIEQRQLTEDWLTGIGDLPADLIQEAHVEILRTAKFMPRPAEFRACVSDKFAQRQRELKRAREIEAKLTERAAKPTPAKVVETTAQRLAGLVRIWTSHGNMLKAAQAEHELAKIENRDCAPWALEELAKLPPPAPPVQRPVSRRTIATPPHLRAGLLVSQVRHWQRQPGADRYVERLETELRDLVAQHRLKLPPGFAYSGKAPIEHRDHIPEAR